jgi:phosphoserine phosphatase
MTGPIIVSDMDGTLTRLEMWRGVLAWIRGHHPSPAARRFVAVRLPRVALVRLGLIDRLRFRSDWVRDLATLLRGVDEPGLDAMGEWVVGHHLWPARRESALTRIGHELSDLRRGSPDAQLILATGSFQPVGAAFGRRIGADVVLGTPLAVVDGLATGGLAAPIQSGDQKAAAVMALADGRTIVQAYGDSGSDIPLLALAGRAVAVAPDALLRAEAARRGWEVLDRA